MHLRLRHLRDQSGVLCEHPAQRHVALSSRALSIRDYMRVLEKQLHHLLMVGPKIAGVYAQRVLQRSHAEVVAHGWCRAALQKLPL